MYTRKTLTVLTIISKGLSRFKGSKDREAKGEGSFLGKGDIPEKLVDAPKILALYPNTPEPIP